MKIVIAGHSGTGKTTLGCKLSKQHRAPLLQTDSLIGTPRAEELDQLVNWLNKDSYVIEGVQAVHALREWKRRNPGNPCPADVVHMLTVSKRELTPKQVNQRTGICTVFNEIKPWLGQKVKMESTDQVLWDFDEEEDEDD